MHIVRTVQAMKHERAQWTGSVGLIPTMGYLHEGHLSLVRQARAEQEHIAVSIFVNPTQFGPHEDLSSYPRDVEHDLQLLETLGVDSVFLPTAAEMYPSGFSTFVNPEGTVAEEIEGAARTGHFRGVATIVLKLFHIIQPQQAYFGQKDAQQVAIIQRMIADLNVPVELRVQPTIREQDGLAMSSRNSYLDPIARKQATIVYRALQAAQAVFNPQSPPSAQAAIQAARQVIASEPAAQLDYIEIRNPDNFQPLEILRAPALLLIAVRLGNTRLIDNFVLHPDGTWDSGQIQSHSSTQQ
ncbi:pantoate--beta-alanine ligase [Dictyobacter arantiisoli]|uniref:Pantothenate synthetase n=1 Tax=Dictyobacter arantiisoli TaxID=2014874 RepID=A0A5A5TC05_9CHLR|nr:pantoate--beta-alanine ligase [Dictyobacter arantiisoli]GCF08877.1 pantothenate synthetase [Dictyobacter arantiisoli]